MTTTIETRVAALGPTVLRVALGVVFVGHAYQKVAVFTFDGAGAFFASQGFPAWSVYPVFAAELLGGIALIAGFRTRWVALALIPIMLGALKTHLPNGVWFTSPNGGWEYPALLVVTLGVQALLGSGAYALDAVTRGVRRLVPTNRPATA